MKYTIVMDGNSGRKVYRAMPIHFESYRTNFYCLWKHSVVKIELNSLPEKERKNKNKWFFFFLEKGNRKNKPEEQKLQIVQVLQTLFCVVTINDSSSRRRNYVKEKYIGYLIVKTVEIFKMWINKHLDEVSMFHSPKRSNRCFLKLVYVG